MNATNGDFIERHAKAVSAYAKTIVLFVDKDNSLRAGDLQVEKTVDGNLIVYKAYYGASKIGGWWGKLQSLLQFRATQRKLYRQIVLEQGAPNLVHVHVAMKAGVLALHLKKTYGLPYIVTEHWTGYDPASKDSLTNKGIAWKYLNKKILQGASFFLPVSRDLGDLVNRHFMPIAYEAVPNVVNTAHFKYQPVQPRIFRFIHASYLNYQKNAEGMILAAAELSKKGYEFELLLLGNENSGLEQLASQHGLLNKQVIIKPAIPYEAVAREMQQSSALILFSRYENLPCVILEALCSGLPVVSSRVGGVGEVINVNNGIMVESENVSALAAAMQKMIDDYTQYDREAIASDAKEKFSYETVAKQYLQYYENYCVTASRTSNTR